MRILSAFLFLLLVLSWNCQSDATETARAIPLPDDGTSIYWKNKRKPFYHGVASGDPLADRVIIWTRVTPPDSMQVEVSWQVATDGKMENIVRSGVTSTNGDHDFTVKIDVDSLLPATSYFYRFSALNAQSVTGHTKTAPAGESDQLNFAVVSCSNFEAGYFNALGRIAEMEELDAVLHLGDYIYEYEPGRYGDTTLYRKHLPPHEIISLADYRTRYSQYRLDEEFQQAHQRHPFICIWDDHEISNNSYKTGAQNHQPVTEGDYLTRAAAARQAYYEWLPVRANNPPKLYRHIQYGDLVDLIMLDERLEGRSAPADSINQPGFAGNARSMLGRTQLQWFKEQLSQSKATWKIIGNQVIFSDLNVAWAGRSPNLDAWDGYPAEKKNIINFLKNKGIQNVILVSGDTHCSWAFEVPESLDAYRKDSTATVAVEFGTTSISSANVDESIPRDSVIQIEQRYQAPENNPHLKYVNLRDHGYLILRITPGETQAEWHYVENLKSRNDDEIVGKILRVRNGSHELQ